MCLFFSVILVIITVSRGQVKQPKISLMSIESEFDDYYSDTNVARWSALDRMTRRDMAKQCVRIYNRYKQTNLGDFKEPVTAMMATYKAHFVKYQKIHAKPKSIITLQCGLDNMIFPKYRGPQLEPFLTFGGIRDDQAYILEERLDGFVYLVDKVVIANKRRRITSCFKCRTAQNRYWYPTYSTKILTEEDIDKIDSSFDETSLPMVQTAKRKRSEEEFESNKRIELIPSVAVM